MGGLRRTHWTFLRTTVFYVFSRRLPPNFQHLHLTVPLVYKSLYGYTPCPEAEFLDIIGKKSCCSVVHKVTSSKGIYPPPPKHCTVYGNLKPENSQDYAQKPQRKCTFMNFASGVETHSVAPPLPPPPDNT